MSTDNQVCDMDTKLMREAIAIADLSAEHGNQPFGALLATKDGQVLLISENKELTKDKTCHAEQNLVRQIYKEEFTEQELREMTLYTSTEPCIMCTGSIDKSKVGRVVYGCSATKMRTAICPSGCQSGKKSRKITCREIFEENPNITLVGPFLEDEAFVSHQNYNWPQKLK